MTGLNRLAVGCGLSRSGNLSWAGCEIGSGLCDPQVRSALDLGVRLAARVDDFAASV